MIPDIVRAYVHVSQKLRNQSRWKFTTILEPWKCILLRNTMTSQQIQDGGRVLRLNVQICPPGASGEISSPHIYFGIPSISPKLIQLGNWNLIHEVIETGTIRKLRNGFLFAFHSNYGSILHDYWDKGRNRSEIAIFSYPLHSTLPFGVSVSVYCYTVSSGNTRMVWLSDGKKVWAVSTEQRCVNDRQTDILRRHSPHCA